MPAPFRDHEDPAVSDAHSDINALSCRLRTMIETAAAIRDGETRISEALTQTAMNRLMGEFHDLIGRATDIASGTRSNTEGSPEGFMVAVRSGLARNRAAAAARHTALDASAASFVGA